MTLDLSPLQILEFRNAYQRAFNTELSAEEARSKAIALLEAILTILTPPKAESRKVHKP